MQAALRGNAVVKGSAEAVEVRECKEYGASYAVMQIAKELELDKVIYSKSSEGWVKDVLAMVVGRLVYAGSKLGLSNRWAERLLDGCYVIKGDVSAEVMAKQEVVASYKKLTLLEQAFRNIKTVQLEVRPAYHKTDARIRCHGMLAYYLQWHMMQRLQPLFKSDSKGRNRRWSFELVIERLKSLRRQTVTVSVTKLSAP